MLSPASGTKPPSPWAASSRGTSVVPSSEFMMDRQAEWEREIETLDHKEMELHQSQFRLVREQTAMFIRDLAELRQEVAVMKAGHSDLEKVVENHAQEMGSQRGSLETLYSRLEQHHGALQERGAHHVSMEKRVDYLEKALSESAGDHMRELEAHKVAHARLVSDIRGFEELIARERKDWETNHDVLRDQVSHHGSVHAMGLKELQDLIQMERSSREQHERQSRSSIELLLQAEKAERSLHHATVTERVDSLQRTVNIFDGLIRKEMDERSKENRRIWEALDSHTRDLSAQAVSDDRAASLSPARSRPATPQRVMETRRYVVPSTTSVSPVTYFRSPQTSPSTPTEPYMPVTVTVSGPSPVGSTTSAAQVASQQLRPLGEPLASPTATAAAPYPSSPVMSNFPARVQSTPTAWGYSARTVGSAHASEPQQQGLPSGRPLDPLEHRIYCGQARYQGEAQRAAEILLE